MVFCILETLEGRLKIRKSVHDLSCPQKAFQTQMKLQKDGSVKTCGYYYIQILASMGILEAEPPQIQKHYG